MRPFALAALAVVLAVLAGAAPSSAAETPRRLLSTPGTFAVGVNYWASHAGTAMWRDWREDVVARDLALLAQQGVSVLRVFPLWPDFQPVQQLRGYQGTPRELRFGERPPPADEVGLAGVSEEALGRFARLADLAHANHQQLVVGLLTGWMSGRLFVPPALEGRNVMTDPLAVQLEKRFVSCFVRRFKGHPAILAWDLGNETNCMADPGSREGAWVWTSAIVDAIRAVDTSRPVVSGMHSLTLSDQWTVFDQGELTDILTVHPYPSFTPHCDLDPPNTMRTLLHAAAEARLYADVGRKPCFVEEIGVLGPMLAGDATAADYLRTHLLSAWAHDLRGLLWWCAFDQAHLEQAPYDWNAVERELGLLRQDGSPKPVAGELRSFAAWLRGLPFEQLPPRVVDARCLLSLGQDHWGVAYGTFVLAKQAGLDVEFQSVTQPLAAADLYLLPSIKDMSVMSRERWHELLERVAAGATLYISFDGGFLSEFEQTTGLRVVTRQKRGTPANVELALGGETLAFSLGAWNGGLTLEPAGAEVLGREPDGNPAFSRFAYGQGLVYFLGVPLEMSLTTTPGAFHGPDVPAYWKVYRHIAERQMAKKRVVSKTTREIGITEHPLDTNRRVAVLINYSPRPAETPLTLAAGWRSERCLRGGPAEGEGGTVRLTIPKNDAAVLLVTRGAAR